MESLVDPDSELMLRVREGDDPEAFRRLFEKHSPGIVRFCARLTGVAARGEELAQDVFLHAYRARERYEARAKFSTWLYTIAHNLCLNELRRVEYRGLSRSIDDRDPPGGPERELVDETARAGDEVAAGQQLEARVRELLAELPENQRSALVLSRGEGLRYQEIGDVLGCSEQAVKSLVFRATQRLKEGLKGYVDES